MTRSTKLLFPISLFHQLPAVLDDQLLGGSLELRGLVHVRHDQHVHHVTDGYLFNENFFTSLFQIVNLVVVSCLENGTSMFLQKSIFNFSFIHELKNVVHRVKIKVLWLNFLKIALFHIM